MTAASGAAATIADTSRDNGGTTAPPAPAAPRISVVIPTYRRPDLLARCLDALQAQRIERSAYEVIVADDGHSAETDAVVERYRGRADAMSVRCIRPQHRHGPAVARNAGWQAARGDVVAFTDDDTIPDPGWLANGERALVPGLAAVSGRVCVPPLRDAALPTDHELMTRGLESAEFVTANAFVRRSALVTVGGFDERFLRAWREDSDLQFRLLERAGPIGRSADAVVLHPVRAEPWGVSLRQQKNVFFDALLYKKHPRLYRERILRAPPWNYYAIVVLAPASLLLWTVGARMWAAWALALAAAGVLQLAWKRLRPTARDPRHVAEMLSTSALIPFLSVYWRLRGALHFRVPYL
jgi:glycosyltransferase involved in cell wall biosynthesis